MKLTRRFSPRIIAAALALAGLCLVPAARRAQGQDAKKDEADRIERLVRQLGAEDPEKRDAAQKELVQLGRPALAALEKAANEDKDQEVKARAQEAAATIRKNLGVAPAAPRQGELEPDEPPVVAPGKNKQPGEDFFKQIPREMPKDLMKLLEQMQKQFEELDKMSERELELPNGRGRVRTWTFGNTPPKAPVKDGLEGRLGLGLGPTTAALRAQLSLGPTDGGVVVNEIVKDGWADTIGLKQYDVLLAFDGRAIRSAADLQPLLEKGGPLELLRKAKLEKLDAPRFQPGKPAPKKDEPRKDEPKKDDVRKF